MSAAQATADWCVSEGGFSISGVRMEEHSRRPEDVKWCFRCRGRHEFLRIIAMPIGMSYYGPDISTECSSCGSHDGDLFPGWSREWE